jgi:hypothetical protein
MLDEACESPHRAWHDSARSWGSRVVRVGGVCRYLAVGLLSGVRRVEARPFLSPYAARLLQQHRHRPGTCAFPC